LGASNRHYKADQPSMPKLTEPLLDTPQSVDVVTRQLMDDQGVSRPSATRCATSRASASPLVRRDRRATAWRSAASPRATTSISMDEGFRQLLPRPVLSRRHPGAVGLHYTRWTHVLWGRPCGLS